MAYDFDQYFAFRMCRGAAFSDDGGEVAFVSNISGQFNLWTVPARGGWPRQHTVYQDATVRTIAWKGRRLVYSCDRIGDEFHQLYLKEGREWPRALTSREKVQHQLHSYAFSPDGNLIAFAANDEKPENMDVKLMDLRTGEERRLFSRGGYHAPGSWSHDGGWLTAIDVTSNTNVDLWLVDTRSGEARHLSPHQGDAVFIPGPWDDRGFYLVTDEGREFKALGYYDVREGRSRILEAPAWDVEAVALSPDGRYLAWIVNEDASHRLHVKDRRENRELDTSIIPRGVLLDIMAPDLEWGPGGQLALYVNQSRRPKDLHLLQVPSMKLTRITDGFIGGIPEEEMVEPELVRVGGIPGFLYRARKSGPALLWMHGGPEAQAQPIYSGMIQYLVSRGISVLYPNIHGSSGYGRKYQKAIHHDWGGVDLADMRALAEWLKSRPWATQLAVMGGSYGGFATLTCASRLPEYWSAAVDIVGPSNLLTFCKSVPPSWKRFMAQWVGDVETESEFLRERSPITYVDQVRCPLMVIQGANDPRVVKAESDQMVERLRGRGVPVEYLVFDDEGHGFTKKSNELKAYRAAGDFLLKHLR